MNLASVHATETGAKENDETDVVIRNYTSMGSIQGYGKVEVEAREVVIPDRRQVSYFVRVEVEAGGDYPQTSATLIQFDNVQKLLNSINKLSVANLKNDRFLFSEIEYEVDGLKIIVFNDAKGKLMVAISIGSISIHFTSISRLADFHALLSRAYNHLDSNKVEFDV